MSDLEVKTDEQLSQLLSDLRTELRMNEYNDSPSSYKTTRENLEASILQVQSEREKRGLL